jgi:hypothetical protein
MDSNKQRDSQIKDDFETRWKQTPNIRGGVLDDERLLEIYRELSFRWYQAGRSDERRIKDAQS